MGKIIDGKSIATGIRAKIKEEVARLTKKPKLVVVLVGDDPGSAVYVRNKEKACAEVGMESFVYRFSSDTSQEQVLGVLEELNQDKSVNGILVQLPLPSHLDENKIIAMVSPAKDVDGIHPQNLGKLVRGEEPPFTPCTPTGIMELIKSTGVGIKGKEAVVVGRSNIVGKPTAILLLKEHATVTICHTRTQDLSSHTRRADILVVAAGCPKVIGKEMVKEGSIIIDVGTNRLETGLAGDVDFDGVKDKTGFITPVPGGVGPMTIAMLLSNTLKAAKTLQ